MMDMFDRMLARDYPLYFAVTDSDVTRMEMEEGRDVNALDNGGRNFVHLVAENPPAMEILCTLLRKIRRYPGIE
jgi:S-adenosylmethionine:diacylglycerol 3-amino-3-carboxypropyl transferase